MKTAALVLAVLAAAPAPEVEPALAVQQRGFLGYLEWMLNVRLTLAQREEAGTLIERAWARKSVAEKKLVTRGFELEKDLANYTREDRDLARGSVEDEYFKTLKRRGNGQPLALWIAGLRTAARRTIAAGPPPLTRQASDALGELAVQILGEPGSGGADKVFRETFAALLATAWGQLGPEERTAVAAAPAAWARLLEAPEAKRDELRQLWRAELTAAVDGGSPAPVVDAKALAALAPRLARAASQWE